MNGTREKVVILGGYGGIGSALARRLAERGTQLYLAGRSQEKLSALADELSASHCLVDATDFTSVQASLEEASSHFGGLTGIVNCVGSLPLRPAHLMSQQDWHEAIAANLTSAFAIVRAAALSMPDGGSVVLISSAAARLGLANHEAIAAAKAGVIGLAQAAAATYASRGLRFNVVAPGLVKTSLTKRIWSNQKSAEYAFGLHALGRLGEPEDIAAMIEWLLTPANDWMTGEVISVDGGLSRVRSTNTVRKSAASMRKSHAR